MSNSHRASFHSQMSADTVLKYHIDMYLMDVHVSQESDMIYYQPAHSWYASPDSMDKMLGSSELLLQLFPTTGQPGQSEKSMADILHL